MNKHFSILFMCFLLLFSCEENKNSAQKNESVPGNYYQLSEDNIEIFLPKYFEKYSETEYKELILKIKDQRLKKAELNRFNYMKFSKGNMYYFKDILSSTLISAKILQYYDFSKRESSQILGMMSQKCEDYAFFNEEKCKKLTAGFSAKGLTKVFKAVYEVTHEEKVTYNTCYLISSNYKTLMLNFYSVLDTDYNKYIEKLIIK
ncbi:MAG TPA: hypothetical protein VKN14_12430 [Flavobacteriaceae bacterium]|nr:hypothetical protein [Flavobacteriaceae bacterium]